LSYPRIKEIVGLIDGFNQDFATVAPFVTGTLQIWHNGVLLRDDLDNGFTEVDPPNGLFQMKLAPRAGDVLYSFYREA